MYKYRGRKITGQMMKLLIVEIESVVKGEALSRQEIIRICEEEHVKRGGIKGEGSPISAFKSAVKALRELGCVEDAGQGYWRVITPRSLSD